MDIHDKQGSHWLSIIVEKGQCEVFDSYGLPLHCYKPSPSETWVFKHYQDVSSNVGQLQATDSYTCGHYALFFLFARARGKSMESFIQPFKYLCDVDNDHKIGENLRKLKTRKKRPFATNDHMVQNLPCWRASSLLFLLWDIKTRASLFDWLRSLCLNVPVQE